MMVTIVMMMMVEMVMVVVLKMAVLVMVQTMSDDADINDGEYCGCCGNRNDANYFALGTLFVP